MSHNDPQEPISPDSARPAGCPGWCSTDHANSSTLHYGPAIRLDLPASPYEPSGPLLLAAIRQSIESEEEEREDPVVNIEGATERELDLPGLDRLIEQLDDYVGQLHHLRQDYAQAMGAGSVSRA